MLSPKEFVAQWQVVRFANQATNSQCSQRPQIKVCACCLRGARNPLPLVAVHLHSRLFGDSQVWHGAARCSLNADPLLCLHCLKAHFTKAGDVSAEQLSEQRRVYRHYVNHTQFNHLLPAARRLAGEDRYCARLVECVDNDLEVHAAVLRNVHACLDRRRFGNAARNVRRRGSSEGE